MGIYDRDYYDADVQSGFRSTIASWPWTYRLIAFTVAVFLIDALSGWRLTQWGCFKLDAVYRFQIWRFFTFQFLHDNRSLGHLFFNMLALFFFGRFVESEIGRRQFLAFYLLCGVSGAVVYLVLALAGAVGVGSMVGASAGVFGVIVACAVIAPNMTVLFMFVFPMPIRVLAILTVAIAGLVLILQGPNAGGEAAHLGGAAVGFFLIHNRGFLAWADRVGSSTGGRRMRFGLPHFKSLLPDRSVSDEELDRLLDKVREHGLDSLTTREKNTLKRASKERRNRQRRF